MKALVIGAAGFVGSYLVSELTKTLKCDVYATVLPSEKVEIDCLEVYKLDILDTDAISSLLFRVQPDIIYHLAAQSSVAISWEKPLLTAQININGTISLLESVRALQKNTRVVLIGSSEEYGAVSPADCPVSESFRTTPANVYAVTKCTQNMLGAMYANAYKLNIVMVRAFNHIGPRQTENFVVSNLCRQVASIEKKQSDPIIYVGNLDAKRDFTDVRDIVRAYGLLGIYGRSGETYNVGSGKAISIKCVLDEILNQSSTKIEVKFQPERMRPSDVPLIEADISKLYADTGWKPIYSICDTISDVLNYWRVNI